MAGGLGPGGNDPDGRALNSVEIYDVASNSWSLGKKDLSEEVENVVKPKICQQVHRSPLD